jgi:hypothetical protein
VSREEPVALGTAGGVAALRAWLDGRDVLVTNADAYLPGPLALADGWDGARCRLLCVPAADGPAVPGVAGGRPVGADFVTPDGRGVRYVGACLLPWAAVRTLRPEPSGLYEVLWRGADLDLVVSGATAIDCGTPADYLAANLHASGGASVVGEGATVLGRLERCVVWDGAYVGPEESLHDAVRAGTREAPLTVHATR